MTGKKTLLKKIKRRRREIVSAAFDRYMARSRRCHQRRQNCLKHQSAAARRTDHEAVLAGLHLSGNELESPGEQTCSFDFRSSDFRGGENGGKVLPKQTRPFPLGADVLDAECFAGGERKAERRAQDLPAAFSRGSVNPNHAFALFACDQPLTQTT